MSNTPSPLRQSLSPQARRDKAARDKAFAMSPARKAKKAHAQRERRKNPEEAIGQDYDHKRQAFVSVNSNRGNEGQGTQNESGNNYNTN
jgi:AMMECR1 domain-containing protein|tara:strand:- start:356 stop:622 length:267 start_codon:yes stop_codon:yes gene_type:complete